MAGSATQPDWASLLEDCWRQIALSAVHVASETLSEHLQACTSWYWTLAAMCSTCKGLRAALLGPGAGEIWARTVFSATHPGLTSQQSRGLNALVAAHSHRSRCLELICGGWDLDELRALTASLTGLRHCLTVRGLKCPLEAAMLSRTLSVRPVQSLYVEGTVACVLPTTALVLCMVVLLNGVPLVEQLYDPASFARFLGCLRPLKAVRKLDLCLSPWRLDQAFVRALAVRHPHLSTLRLSLSVCSKVGMHDVESLQHLSPSIKLVLNLRIWDEECLAVLLQQLLSSSVQMHDLALHVKELSPAVEELLARCMTQTLTLCFPDSAVRMRLPPPAGVTVRYRPEQSPY